MDEYGGVLTKLLAVDTQFILIVSYEWHGASGVAGSSCSSGDIGNL